VFEYLGTTNEHVRYIDDEGNVRLIQINNTSLYIPAIGELSINGSFIASIDELLALKGLVDKLQG